MKRAFFRAAVGLTALPENQLDLSRFLRWAAHDHILGQVAAAHVDEAGGKLKDVLENARIRSAHDRRMLTFEADRISRALLGSGIEPVLLKGGAYVAAGLRAGRGRRVSDIDILVEDQRLAETEVLLREAGWQGDSSTAGDYDQQYYRRWMHELPPMRHGTRRTLIDVHHRLLPRTARLQPRHDLMMAASVKLESTGLRAFSPMDRFIHSAIHICADGAFETVARSFIELYYLFGDLEADDRRRLIDRAAEVNALKPVASALWAVSHYFGSANAHAALRSMGVMKVGVALRFILRVVVRGGRLAPVARLALYVRSHYMRMPLAMLAKHLFSKAFKRGGQARATRSGG
ncbi:nucleotidyltransferase domain-containing protein [Kordiimonas aestuarii]|uniref:nucleotidyltransferase domain-containing protein n=1 Tax=Kordiimonas aestuarii TaxID=1005925 RepID=UPI0021D26082|nr:nucleotidyltransferase family protein [Kordiimonas aestuarii]